MFLFGFLVGAVLMGLVWMFSRSLARMARAAAVRAGASVEHTADDLRRQINLATDKLAKMEP